MSREILKIEKRKFDWSYVPVFGRYFSQHGQEISFKEALERLECYVNSAPEFLVLPEPKQRIEFGSVLIQRSNPRGFRVFERAELFIPSDLPSLLRNTDSNTFEINLLQGLGQISCSKISLELLERSFFGRNKYVLS